MRVRRFIQISVLTFAFAGVSYAGIVNTVHNMSTTGPGTVKASATQPAAVQGAEQEICVFCHTPHSAKPVGFGAPLWNRDIPAATGYTMYQSDYLKRIGYSPAVYDSTTAQPGLMSLVCLSCHDGTIAIGKIYAYKNSILGSTLLAMQGVSGSGTLPSTDTAYFGANLSSHHPVGIQYNTGVSKAFGSGTRTIELLASPASPVVTWSGYVECSSCHDPHNQGHGKFLRVTSGANLGADISTTCTSCHNKTGWTGSAHQSLTYNYVDTNVAVKFGTSAMNSLACINCHQDHNGLANYLLRQQWSRTCFQGAGANNTECHATVLPGDTTSLATVFGRAAKHPIVSDGVTASKHSDLDVLYPAGGTPIGSNGLYWSTFKHAECVDCHNPHQAKSTPQRVLATAWYPATVSATSNLASNSGPLTGVTGVDMSALPANWTVQNTLSSWRTYETSQYEYQICFKCHSWYALQEGITGVSSYNTTFEGAPVTDQAMEFNPNNLSAHPVMVALNNQTGSYAPKPLAASEVVAPWTSVGNQTMYCSDCHGADNEASGDPKGPHGSSYKYVLKGTGRYWPANASGTLYNYTIIDANLFCANCHVLSVPNAHTQNTTMKGVACVACHVAIPHGWKRSRLIAYAGEASPYNYGGSTAILNGIKKDTSPTYGKSNCYSTNAACSSGHGTNAGGYDP